MPEPPRPLGPLRRHAAPRGRRRPDYRRALPVALLVSAGAHVLALSAPLPRMGAPPGRGEPAEPTSPPLHGAMRAIGLRAPPAFATTPPEEGMDVEEAPSEPGPDPEPGREPGPVATPFGPPPPAPAARALWPSLRDARLWAPPTPAADSAGPEAERLRSRIDVLSEATLGIKTLPGGDMSAWVARDARGGRWGLSPGALHLGDLTVPLCSGTFDASTCGFGIPSGYRDRYRAELRALVELQRQGARAEVQDRARALRARLDARRDSVPAR